MAKMYRVPPDWAWWPAVGAPPERGFGLGDGQMITLASVIERFEADYSAQYQNAILPSHRQALRAMKGCRSSVGAAMLAQCSICDAQRLVPHSCGNRNCPHCQHFESQR